MIRNRSGPIGDEDSVATESASIPNTPSKLSNSSSSLEMIMGSNESSPRKMNRRGSYFVLAFVACMILTSFMVILNKPDHHWNPSVERIHFKASHPSQFTIVINTFKRHEMMVDAVRHYSKCGFVKHIYIVWCENDPPTEALQSLYATSTYPTVNFVLEKDSLNARFKPLKGPHTDGIFTVDDDMRVECSELALAHETWRQSSRSIVGFMPRMHLRAPNGNLIYRCWWRVWWSGRYSIILTKAAFLHHDYLLLYSAPANEQIRKYVDEVSVFV
jgi:hypothetical protein